MQENILVIKLGALGDLILAFDAFQAIAAAHKDARITLMTRRNFHEFAKMMPWFDDILLDDSPNWRSIRKWLSIRRSIKNGEFSIVYDLQGNDRTRFYSRIVRHENWIGPSIGPNWRQRSYNTDPLSSNERLLRFLESIDIPRTGFAENSWLTGNVSQFNLPRKFVLLIAGCSAQHPHKRWPPAHYVKLANALKDRSLATVAVGTEIDRVAIDAIRKQAPHVLDLAGKTSIEQLAEIARQSQGVIGNDTGPIHIAAATGAPTLVLMSGKSCPKRMLPHGPDVGYLQEDELSDLTPETVLGAIRLRQNEA